MDPSRVEAHRGAGGTSSKPVHTSAGPDGLDGGLPGLRLPHRLEHRIETSQCLRMGDHASKIPVDGNGDDLLDPERLGDAESVGATSRDRDPSPERPQHDGGQETDRAAAENQDPVPRLDAQLLDPEEHTGQRFGHRRGAEVETVRNPMEICPHDSFRNHDGFRVGPIEEEQILTQLLLSPLAWSTSSTRGRVRRHHPITGTPIGNPGPCLDNHPGQLMTEPAGWREHPRVVATAPDLEIRAAGEGCLDPDTDLATFQGNLGDLPDFQGACAEQIGRLHGTTQPDNALAGQGEVLAPSRAMDMLRQALEFVLHLQDHLYELTRSQGPWIYAILFTIIFCETGLVATPFLPGDSLLFAVGAVAANPASGLNVWMAGLLMLVAAILGDTVNYWVGRFAGRRLSAAFPRIIKPEYLERTHAFFEKYGGKTVILARFVPIIRTFAPFVAGMGSMNYSRFMTFNVVGAALWIALILPAGWYLGQFEFVKKRFELIVIGIIVVSLLPMVFEIWKANRESKRTASSGNR